MKFDRLYKLLLEKKKYGHTLWIKSDGKVIDLKSEVNHYNFIAQNFNKLFPDEEFTDKNVYDIPYKKGWVRIRNFIESFMVPSISIYGKKEAIRKHRKTLYNFVFGGYEKIRSEGGSHVNIDISYDDRKRLSYRLPDDFDDIEKILR